MNKRVIIIAGNIASGKTALANEMQKRLKNFTLLSMDAERWAACGEGLVREHQAEYALIDKLLQHNRVIYETTAFGKPFKVMEKLLTKEKATLVCIKLDCHPDECLRRYQERSIHPPMPFKFDVEDSLWKIHANLRTLPGISLDSQHHSPQALVDQIL